MNLRKLHQPVSHPAESAKLKPREVKLHFGKFLALHESAKQAERLFAGMEMRLHRVSGLFWIPAAYGGKNFRVLSMRIFLDAGKLLRLADPLG